MKEQKSNIRKICNEKNQGLWKYTDSSGSNYLSLYQHENENYFSITFDFAKGNYGGFMPGKYVLIGKYIVFVKWNQRYKHWEPYVGRYHINSYYTKDKPSNLGSAYPIKKASVVDIASYGNKTKSIINPTVISEDDSPFVWIESLLYRLACEKDPKTNDRDSISLKKCTEDELLREDERTYGNEYLKKCYINPFLFEKQYSHMLKQKGKKWWNIFAK